MEAIVRTAAGMFEAAACSIALTDPKSGELVYEAAWGAGAVRGRRHAAAAGRRASPARSWRSGEGVVVPECRKDPRFARQVAARTGYVPYTMVVAPLDPRRQARSACSRCSTAATAARTCSEDLGRAALFADLAVVALDLDTFPLSSRGGRTLLG